MTPQFTVKTFLGVPYLGFGRTGRYRIDQWGRRRGSSVEGVEYATLPRNLNERVDRAIAAELGDMRQRGERTRFHSTSDEKRLYLEALAARLNAMGAA